MGLGDKNIGFLNVCNYASFEQNDKGYKVYLHSTSINELRR